MPTRCRLILSVLFVLPILLATTSRARATDIIFNLNFEGGSLGRIERLGDANFRCHVLGQEDEHGRNRQATWYYFRMDHVGGKDVTITLTDFVGEYHNQPGANPMGPDIVPVFSDDGRVWRHFPSTAYDAEKKETTLRFKPAGDSIWIAHVPPYTPGDLHRLLNDLHELPCAAVEMIGKTVQGRDIPLVTVTNADIPDASKKLVWLQARQHAWEAGTSFTMEGALRFITSDDAAAQALRDKVVFKFTPMVDIDGCANGQVRCNANGYDVNQHWREVDLVHPEFLRWMPEIWYTKKAILGCNNSGHPIDLLVNMHNTETGEFLDTEASDADTLKLMRRFDALLMQKTSFDPSASLTTRQMAPDDTNSLYGQAKIPVLLMEQRISTSKKLGRHPTTQDRLAFGKQLIQVMAEAAMTK
jgi:hypothetical protein